MGERAVVRARYNPEQGRGTDEMEKAGCDGHGRHSSLPWICEKADTIDRGSFDRLSFSAVRMPHACVARVRLWGRSEV